MAMSVRYTTINGRIVAENRGGTRKYYSSDALGSTVALYDSSGSKTDSFKYWPYGQTRSSSGSTPTKYKFVGTLGRIRAWPWPVASRLPRVVRHALGRRRPRTRTAP